MSKEVKESSNTIYITANHKDTYEFEMVQEMLDRVGVQLDVFPRTDGYDYLSLRVDIDKFDRVTKRQAGRQEVPIQIEGYFKDVKVDEVRELMRIYGAQEVATHLGISRRTLYRRLKEAKENGWDTIC